MLPVTHGADSILAMQNGAYQKATISVYDVTTSGTPLLMSFTNANIIQGSLTVTKSCSSSETLELGSVISDELRVRVKSSALAGTDITGQVVSMYIDWSYDGNANHLDSVYAFAGIVTEVKALGNDIYQLTAYDAMVVFDKPYKASDISVTYPITVLNLFKAIAWGVGSPYVEQNVLISAASPVNSSVTISGIDESMGLTYRQVLKYCAQLMGVNVRMSPSATHPLELWRWAVASNTQAVMDAVELDENNCFKKRVEPLNVQLSNVGIINGNSILYQGRNTGEYIPVYDNPLLLKLYGELPDVGVPGETSWESVCGSINHAVYTSLPSSYDRVDATTTSMWYLQPGDIIYAFQDNFGYLCVVTEVTHKLNGSSHVVAKVSSPINTEYATYPSFSVQQQNELTARFQDLVYQPGDGYNSSASGSFSPYAYGFITNGGADLNISFPLPKMMPPSIKVSVSSILLYLRIPTGGWVQSSGFDASSYVTTTIRKSGNVLHLLLSKSGGWGVTNNTPVAGQVNINLSFS